MAATWAQWLLVNIGKACRWRGNTTQNRDGCGNTYNSDCTAGGHDCEGGVDIPLTAGTPIYALAGGTLIGNGPWKGHGVITTNVQGVGKVYYQHLDVLASFPQCTNGNCPSVYIPQGTLLGYSNDTGEVEVGINPAWGGIWGPPTNGQNWSLDPRAALVSMANGNITPDSSGCVPCGPARIECCSPMVCQNGLCVIAPIATATQTLQNLIPSDWINPVRILKLAGGIVGLILSLIIIFWPETKQAISIASKAAVL